MIFLMNKRVKKGLNDGAFCQGEAAPFLDQSRSLTIA